MRAKSHRQLRQNGAKNGLSSSTCKGTKRNTGYPDSLKPGLVDEFIHPSKYGELNVHVFTPKDYVGQRAAI